MSVYYMKKTVASLNRSRVWPSCLKVAYWQIVFTHWPHEYIALQMQLVLWTFVTRFCLYTVVSLNVHFSPRFSGSKLHAEVFNFFSVLLSPCNDFVTPAQRIVFVTLSFSVPSLLQGSTGWGVSIMWQKLRATCHSSNVVYMLLYMIERYSSATLISCLLLRLYVIDLL